MNLFYRHNLAPINEQPFEIVERKGLGHPDTVADGIAESISIDYSKYCLDKFGVVLHHNVDKISIVGGLCEIDFGLGEMRRPVELILNGRMSEQFGDRIIDIKKLQIASAKNYLQKVLPKLDINKWLKINSFVSSSSRNPFWFHPRTLDDLPEIRSPYANDTSTIVGFWPLSVTEKIVLDCEKFFYNSDLTPKFDFIGQDIKVMAIRNGKNLDLIMCVPFFSREISSSLIYEDKLKFLEEELSSHIKDKYSEHLNINLYLNTEDQRVKDKTTARGYYFVVTGSALDYGEEGVAGRGNRSQGFISSVRPYSIESVCGKNPVYHTGKVYAYIVDLLAKKVATELECEVNIVITTRNGDPLYNPYSVIVNTSVKREIGKIRKIVIEELKKKPRAEEMVRRKIFLPVNNLNYEL